MTTFQRGSAYPIGATVDGDSVNFSLYSSGALQVELLFFDDVDDDRPSRVFTFDPGSNRTFHYWHRRIEGVRPGQLYGYRVSGPYDPARHMRFDGEKLLLDPYAKAVAVGANYDRQAASRPGPNLGQAMKSVVAARGAYDWEGDAPLSRPYAESVIYEMHVGGFTRHESSGLAPEVRGTFRGLIEKIPYLQHLGVTAVELLPVFQFDEQDCPPGLSNYWGYSPVSFFAPHHGFAACDDPLGAIDEFRDMVKALHRAGIEVILDVVYNHTAEGDQRGPTFCFRGLDDGTYYLLEQAAGYSNYSGTGNTMNANHSVVRRLIIHSLRYWVEEMHVDGFRFDLASSLTRGESGEPLSNAPVLWAIESDPRLVGTKIIAEAWDAGGLYQVGSFLGDRWTEWNGRFRDDVRAFIKGDPDTVPTLPTRMLGSPDLYGDQNREPGQSINFVTCHDGFTVNDLVSYNQKHNLDNGEDNRDGSDHNLSWNCGAEGPTDDPDVEALRNRQVKNLLTLLLLSVGTPMLLMGDEVRRTQRGNNNVYCQDNELSWLDWRLLDEHADIHRFVRYLIRGRLLLDMSMTMDELPLSSLLNHTRITWHGQRLHQPDWSAHSRTIAATFVGLSGRREMHIIANSSSESLSFELPPADDTSGTPWRRIIDTALDAPDDIQAPDKAPPVTSATYDVFAHSVVLLWRPASSSPS